MVLSVKFGDLRDPSNAMIGIDARPASVKNFLTYTLRRLGTDYVDIYRPARVDPAVPIEDTIGAVTDMIRAGYVRYAGLSEAGVDFVKTSTGYGTGGAGDKDIKPMRKYSDPKIQIKAAGGVRTLERAIEIRELGCTRFGCTATVGILERLK